MEKIELGAVLLLSCLLLSNHAYAQSAYVGPLNTGLGNGAGVSCNACHSGVATGANAVLPMANTWRSGANLALSDSDNDGFNNAQEVSGASVNFNFNTISPFSLAKAVESSTSTKVVVKGAGIVTENAITDIYVQAGITLAPGHEIAGLASPVVNTFPATITFNKAVNAGDKVYVVDLAAKTNTLVTTGVTFNADGSVTVSGFAPVNLVVDRVIPVLPAAGAVRGGENEEGCILSIVSTPILMWLSLFLISLLICRKSS